VNDSLRARTEAFLTEFPFLKRYVEIHRLDSKPLVQRVDLDLLDCIPFTGKCSQTTTVRFLLIDVSALLKVKNESFTEEIRLGTVNNKKVSIKGYIFSLEKAQENSVTIIVTEVLSEDSSCRAEYELTAEAKVIAEQSPTLITDWEKKCGEYYFTFDYLSPGPGWSEDGEGSFYTNTNPQLRTFRVDSSVKIKLTDKTEASMETYVATLKKLTYTIFNQDQAYIRSGLSEPGIASPVFSITIKNGIVDSIAEVYLS